MSTEPHLEPGVNREPSWRWPALALAGLVLVCYLPALFNGYIWDDDNYVLNNVVLRSLGGLARLWTEPRSIPQYYPLVHTTFWIEYQLWGAAPFGYHLVNMVLHAASAIVLWRLLKRLGVPGAWLGAALFAIHPVQVESVAWVTERKNVLSALFYLLGALAYLPLLRTREDERWHDLHWQRYALALLAYVAALLSKTVTCSLPAALLVIAWWESGWTRQLWRRAVALAPFFAIGLPLALLTAHLEKTHVGAFGSEWDFSLIDRCLIAGRAVFFYLVKVAWPWPTVFIYPRWKIDAGVWWQYVFPLVAVALVMWPLLARGLPARRRRGLAAWALIYIGTLVPALGFFDVYPFRYSFVADHFQYLAMVAVCAAAGAAVAHWLPGRKGHIVAGVWLAVLGVLTCIHTTHFRNEESLWRHTIARNPGAWIAHNNLGLILMQRGDLAGAATEFERTIALYPRHANARINLGLVYERLGRTAEALEQFREGLALEPFNPLAANEVGMFFARQGEYAKAAVCFRTAIELSPGRLPPYENLANVLRSDGRAAEAAAVAEKGLAQARRQGRAEIAARLEALIRELGTGQPVPSPAP